MRAVSVVVLFFAVASAAALGVSVRLAASRVAVVPDTPRGGRAFAASMRVTRRDGGTLVRTGKVTCGARVGSKPLVRVRAGFRSGRVSCTWRLPASASGKHVLGWLRLDALATTARRFFGRPIL